MAKKTPPPLARPKRPTPQATNSQPPSADQRQVECFECRHIHLISSRSSSTLCPKCGTYISLQDYEIKDIQTQGIKTRGNVFVHKKGHVSGVTVHCHDLIVEGEFNGGVDCSGDFIMRSHGKILGRVYCQKLIVQKKAKVNFMNSIECHEISIDGTLSGNIRCTGKLTLEPQAILTGNIEIGSLEIKEGAKHTGQVSMNPHPS